MRLYALVTPFLMTAIACTPAAPNPTAPQAAAVNTATAVPQTAEARAELPTVAFPAITSNSPSTPMPNGHFDAKLLEFAKSAAPKNTILGASVIRDVLLMATLGAKGKTESELRETLGVKATDTIKASLSGTAFGDAEVLASSRVWLSRDYSAMPDYTTKVKDGFGASFGEFDRTKTESARASINQWVSTQTKTKISELLPSGSITPQTAAVLTSAIYLNAAWETQFTAAGTAEEPFMASANAPPVKVPMMRRVGSMKHAEVAGNVLVELAYKNSTLVMDAILPKKGANAVDAESLDALLAKAEPHMIALGLPRTKLRYAQEITPALQSLGIREAFSQKADFAGMLAGRGAPPLKIDAVHTSTFLSINETGTEAAAAAAAVIGIRSAPRVDVIVTFDRPFYAFIRDRKSGAILFAAWIQNPAG
jgi:serpin B